MASCGLRASQERIECPHVGRVLVVRIRLGPGPVGIACAAQSICGCNPMRERDRSAMGCPIRVEPDRAK